MRAWRAVRLEARAGSRDCPPMSDTPAAVVAGRGEAIVVMLLRRLEAAAEGAAPALLHSSAVNQDGRSSSLTSPHGPSQTALLRACLQSGPGWQPEPPAAASMHGTGTPLGDPIELNALGTALGVSGQPAGRAVQLISSKARGRGGLL